MIKTIEQTNISDEQKSMLMSMDKRLNEIDGDDNQSLDNAVHAIKKVIKGITGAPIERIINVGDYVINHRTMMKDIKKELLKSGLQGKTDFDNQKLATITLSLPIRSYHMQYYVSPKHHQLANLNTDKGQTVRSLEKATLKALTKYRANIKS